MKTLFENFQVKFCKSPPHINYPPHLLTFVAKFEIPWCFFFKFGHGFSPESIPQLWKIHMVKWWDKFDQNRFNQIKNFIDDKSSVQMPPEIPSTNPLKIDDHITKLQNLINSNPEMSPDDAKMQILKEMAAQLDMVISPESTANEGKKKKIKISTSTPEIEEIEDSEN